jgi:hypothetical protein
MSVGQMVLSKKAKLTLNWSTLGYSLCHTHKYFTNCMLVKMPFDQMLASQIGCLKRLAKDERLTINSRNLGNDEENSFSRLTPGAEAQAGLGTSPASHSPSISSSQSEGLSASGSGISTGSSSSQPEVKFCSKLVVLI